jgi:hypothetical protein
MQGKLPKDLQTDFALKYNLDRAQVLDRIYKKPMVQQFLSSFFDFYLDHRTHAVIAAILDGAFDNYFKTYLLPTLKLHPGNAIHFVGIVAGNFQEELRAMAKKHGLEITSITKEPIYNLLNYYSN